MLKAKDSKYVILNFKPQTFQSTLQNFLSELENYEKTSKESHHTPKLLGITVWHIDEITDDQATETLVRELWDRIITLFFSQNPKNLHLIYFSGVFDVNNYGKDDKQSPTSVKWVPLEPFSVE